MRKLAPILLSSSLLIPGYVYGLGLSGINVNSALNEKFSADIPMLALHGIQPADIHVNLANSEEFARLDIERPYVLTQLSFNVSKDKSGQPVIHISTKERIAEPYLNFVVRVDWPGGERYLRAYTVLLDPPSYSAPSKYSIPNKRTTVPAVIKPREIKRPKISQLQPQPVANKPVIVAVKKKAYVNSYGPVKQGDSLWRIANLARQGTTLTIDQTMLAIAGANPQAFIGGNINRLKADATLNIPTHKQMSAIDSHLARREVQAHNKSWHQHTAINHVLPQPYMVARDTQQPTPERAEPNSPQTDKQESPAHVLTMKQRQDGVEWNPLLQKLSNNASDLEKKLSAELALSVEASHKTQQSNEVLQEQLTMLQQQNQELQRQLLARTAELTIQEKQNEQIKARLLAANIQTPVDTTSQPGLSGQGSGLAILGAKHSWDKLLLSLLAVFAGGGIAAGTIALRRRRKSPAANQPSAAAVINEPKQTKPIQQPQADAQSEQTTTQVDITAVAGEDVIATKLDLATAYMSMDDYQSAKDILLEIEHQGSEQQQQEIERLLDAIRR